MLIYVAYYERLIIHLAISHLIYGRTEFGPLYTDVITRHSTLSGEPLFEISQCFWEEHVLLNLQS